MHRVVQNEIERALSLWDKSRSNAVLPDHVLTHLEQCEACRLQLAGMTEHAEFLAQILGQIRPPEEAEPRAGFYARVLERIETDGPGSIWNLFIESAFGRRIAVASLALAVLLGVYLVSSERSADDPIVLSRIAVAPSALPFTQSAAATSAAFPGQGFSQGTVEQTIEVDIQSNQLNQVFVDSLPVSQVSVEHDSNDSVLSNLMTYREQ